MKSWIRNLFSSRQAGSSAVPSRLRSTRRYYLPRLEQLELRLAPATQVFGNLTFSYTESNDNVFAADGTLESTTLPVTVGITQAGEDEGEQNNIPVLNLAGGVTLTLGDGGILPGLPPASGEPTTGADGLVTFTSGAAGPVTEVLDGNDTELLTGDAHTFDAVALLSGIGTSFSMTEVTPISIPDSVIVTPASMESYIVPNASLVIDSGLDSEETVTVSAVTATTFTATFENEHDSGFSIGEAGDAASPTTTANQALTGTQTFVFQNIAIAGSTTAPVLNLFSSGSGVVNSGTTVSFAQYAGPLEPAVASLVPLAANSYVQFSNAGPLLLGPNTDNWSWTPSENVSLSLGSSTFTTTGFVATYNANLKQLSASGAGILFANFNKATTLAAAVQPTDTTIPVTGWDIEDASLPYQIRIDDEAMNVASATEQTDGSYLLEVERGQYGAAAATHAPSTAVIGGINVLLGGAATSTAVSSPGLIVTNNVITLFDLTVINSAPITLTSAFSITPTALQFSYSQTTDDDGNTHDVFAIAGGASFSYATDTSSGTFSLGLGEIGAPGIVIEDGVLQSLNASISDTSENGISIGGAKLVNSSLSLQYEPASETYAISGSTELQLPDAEDPVAVSGSISIEEGVLSAFSLSVEAAASFTVRGATFTANSLAFSYSNDDEGATITLSGAAGMVFTVGGQQQSVDVALGDGLDTPGMVIQGGELQSLNATVSANFTIKGLSVTVDQLTVAYDKAEDSFILDGSVGISTASFNLSATFGDGGDNHGIVIQGGQLESLYIVANGGFSLYGLTLQATAVTIVYDAAEDQLALSGGVTVALTSKFSFSASIADSTPLVINTQTGEFSIPDGLEISGSLKIGSVISADVTVNYTPVGDSFDLSVTGQVTIGKQFTVSGAFSLVGGQLQSIALSFSNSRGIAIGATGLFLTELGGSVDNINDPSQLIVSGHLTVYGMGAVKIKGYSLIEASGSFEVSASGLKLTGEVSLVGGILGKGRADLDINWSAGIYTVSASVKLFAGIINFNGLFSFDSKGNITISAMAGINIPDGVPFIGGTTLASLNFYLQIRPDQPDTSSFVAAWTTFTIPIINKTVGIGFQYNFANQLSVISGPPPEAEAAATPPQTLTVTSSLASGPGSLADAIAKANAHAASTAINIEVSSIQLGSPLAITTSRRVTIVGPGASQLTIHGNGRQVFNIAAEADVSISGLTIAGGSAVDGGGISNSGTLLLSNAILRNNTATGNGGAIWNSGTLSLSDCYVSGNTAAGGTGGIFSTGSLSLSSSTVADNNYTSATPLPLTVVAPDIDGKVDAGSSENVIGVADSHLSGISNGDADDNKTGTAAAPINPFNYTVNVLTDAGVGSGQTGDLRYCVTQVNANAAAGFPQTIEFASSVQGQTITLTGGLLELSAGTGTITIDGGGGVTISGGDTSRVFQVNQGTTAVFTDLTITRGHAIFPGGEAPGGGIDNAGTLTLSNSTITANTAVYGAGILNVGVLTVSDSTIDGNSSDSYGAGIYNQGTMTVTSSTVSNNSVTGTAQFAVGGGIYNQGTLTVSSSTINGNSAVGSGGGIWNSQTLTLSNVTISGNSASSGGAIFNSALPPGGFAGFKGELTVSSSTISGNAAAQGPGIVNTAGSTLTLDNTIVAGNSPGSGAADITGSASGNNNLIGIGTGSDGTGETGLTNGVNGNQVGSASSPADPRLGPLTDHGGSTDTMALLPGSPAIGASSSGGATSVVMYNARAGATTILVDKSAAISPGQTMLIDNQRMQVTSVAAAQFITLDLQTPLTESIAAGTPVYVSSGNFFISNTSVGYGAATGATTLLVGAPPGKSLIFFLGGNSYGVTGLSALASYDIVTVSSPLSADVSAGALVRAFETDQRGALRPTGASDIGAYQTVAFTVNTTTDPGPADNFLIVQGTVIDNTTTVRPFSSSSLRVGMLVRGTGIPDGTTIAAIDPDFGDLTLSARVTLVGLPNFAILPLAFGQRSASGMQGDLRYCVFLANAEVSLGLGLAPTIQFAPSLNGKTITLQDAPLELESATGLTTIDGAGKVTISGGGSTGVFQIDAGAEVDLTGLTITGGKATSGAGINNAGSLTLTNVTISGNSADDTGGGIYNTGTLTVTSATISGNSSGASGGGIHNTGTLTLTDDTISGNSADATGGGIDNDGTMTVDSVTFTGNSAVQKGGGIDNDGTMTVDSATFTSNSAADGAAIDNALAGTLTISTSTFAGNTASSLGGGIVNSGTLSLTSSTLANNSAANGGALHGNGSGSNLTLTHVTIAGNSASGSGGGISNQGGTLSLQNTLVAGNTATISSPDLAGSASGSNNLIGDGTGTTGLSNGASSNRVGSSGSPIVPRLAPLADNGGTTETMALLSGSPAIAAGVSVPSVHADQRGAPLPASAPDIGAYQTQVFVVTTSNDSIAGVGTGFTGDLRYAVGLANANVDIGVSATITFAHNLDGQTITLQNGPLQLTNVSTTIDGAGQGITIAGSNFVTLQGRTSAGSTTVSGLRSTSALSVGMRVTGAGIPLDDTIAALGPNAGEIQLSAPATATGTMSLAFGATGSVFTIDADTVVTLKGLTISNGNGAQGGGIDNAGTLTLIDATISGNFANTGGGIYNSGALTLNNTTVKGNTAISGGQISNVGSGTITGPATVALATPSVASIQPVNITYGTPLANSQLHGSARSTVGGLSVSVAGTFTYTSAAGSVPRAGNGQSANVTFTPTDTARYAPVTTTVTINVNKANAIVVVTPYTVNFDGQPHTATFTITGVNGETGAAVGAVDVSSTTHTRAGTYTGDVWRFHDASGNYNDASGTVTNHIIKANATVVVTPYTVTFDGQAHTATFTITGVNGESGAAVGAVDVSNTTHTSPGIYTDIWTFNDLGGNYNDASGTVTNRIIATTAPAPTVAAAPTVAPAAIGATAGALTEAEALHDVHVRQVAALFLSLVATRSTTPAAQAWVAKLDAGVTLDRVARAIARSPQALRKMSSDIFKQYLGRTPSAAELAPLLVLARKGRFDLVRANVLGSAAYFQQRARRTNARFLDVLAADVLGRKLDARTRATLAAMSAQGATRTDLARKLLASQLGTARIAQQLAARYGAARIRLDTRFMAATLALGASEQEVILLLVLQRGQLEANAR